MRNAMNISSLRTAFGAVAMAAAVASTAYAQDMPPATGTPPASNPEQTANPPAPPATAAPQPAAHVLGHAELDRLLAPIALYPDQLVGQILMASTYPLEIVEAARWVRIPANRQLQGDALTAALKERNWDPAVMALIPFPRVLANMDAELDWTKQLGDAFLAQQADVMDSVQRLRQQAMAAGNLKTTPECHCTVGTVDSAITIAPVSSGYLYVPVYNPTVIYGAWAYPDYPPFAFPIPVGFAFAPGLPIGFYPGIDIALFGPIWGWQTVDWSARSIFVDQGRFAAIAPSRAAFAGGVWVHDPSQRGDVAYRNPAVVARFNGARVDALSRGRTFDRPFNSVSTPGHVMTHQTIGGSRFGGTAFRGNSAFHSGPALHAAPAFHAAPVSHAAPAFHAGAGFHGSPAFHGAPHMPAVGVSGAPHAMGRSGGGAPHVASPGGGGREHGNHH
jgi:hypothetical protein